MGLDLVSEMNSTVRERLSSYYMFLSDEKLSDMNHIFHNTCGIIYYSR